MTTPRDIKAQIMRLKAELEASYRVLKENEKNMTKEQKIEAVFLLPSLTAEHIELLEENGFVTGSTVFGGNVDPTDVDYVVQLPPRTFDGYAIGAVSEDYWNADGMCSIYAHEGPQLVNIICMSDQKLFDAWRMTTELINTILEHSPYDLGFKMKWKRVRVFRALVDVLYEPAYRNSDAFDSIHEALRYQKCMKCGREAVNFTCKAEKDKYLQIGICERCSTSES